MVSPFISVPTEHPFAPYIRLLGKGKKGRRDLLEEEAFSAFSLILQEQVSPEQLGAFLMLMRVKEETATELCGFVNATRQHIQLHPPQTPVHLDWPSYAGKKRQYPWFILAALTLARHGVNIVMHGACGHTENRIYTQTALSALGYLPCTTTAAIEHALQQHHFAYIPLDALSPPLAHIIQLKPLLGLRSPVHTLARLINPFNAPFSLQSIFHPAYRSAHHQAALQLGIKNTMVIKGEGGEFERNPDANTLMLGIHEGTPYALHWPMLNSTRTPDEPYFDLNTLKQIWEGTQTHAYGEQTIIHTLAIILIGLKQTAFTPDVSCAETDVAESIPYSPFQTEAIALATQLWQARHCPTYIPTLP